jgi:hypothetical protein
MQSTDMRYRIEPDRSLGALVHLFLQNASSQTLSLPPSADLRLRGRTPEEWLQTDDWAWHDFPSAWKNETLNLPPGALTVWSWNGKRSDWGIDTTAELKLALPLEGPSQQLSISIAVPQTWISAVTFLGTESDPFPDNVIFHVANESSEPVRLEQVRLWLPAVSSSFRALLPQPWIRKFEPFPSNGRIPANNRGGARIQTGRLPLTYTALEIQLRNEHNAKITLWGYLRIKREWFDISGGWVASRIGSANTLHFSPFLKTLRRMHIDTAHIADLSGYTDQNGADGLYTAFPLKYFNKLEPFDHYDTDAMLPRIHAVEFLGEPQYGGGKPVLPMTVWEKLAPYQRTRLATTLTHSEERVWRYYAGLSDFPHFDAYRVTAPSADAWSRYDRWNGQSIRWGAPLESIGIMCRSLRELNRPRPIAYWSQGAHSGWSSYGGRQRTSPTPDELRLQAYHALSSRITSLYWFNLSLKSLLKFPDLIEPITRVGREIRMLADYYLEGDAFEYRAGKRDGRPDWDLASVTGPQGALLFALDLDYSADPVEKIFRFGEPREARFRFRLPTYLQKPAEVFRVDADGTTSVKYSFRDGAVEIEDRASRVAIYVISARKGERERIEVRRKELVGYEDKFGFDPGKNPADLSILEKLLVAVEQTDAVEDRQ